MKGKSILVTGASSGIGRQTAIECSKAGARLIITGRNESRLKETFDALTGNAHEMVIADLLKEKELDMLVSETGKIDGVVLCAGKAMTVPVQFSSREKMDDIFNINFFSPVELLRQLYKKKVLLKGSSVVIIDSIGGTICYSPGNSIYGASKAALNSMMRFCAIEFASRQIRVNCICPGMVETPLIHSGMLTQEQLEEDKQKYLLKRYGRPEDVAYACIYLLSEASSWVTGQDLVIDGGITVR